MRKYILLIISVLFLLVSLVLVTKTSKPQHELKLIVEFGSHIPQTVYFNYTSNFETYHPTNTDTLEVKSGKLEFVVPAIAGVDKCKLTFSSPQCKISYKSINFTCNGINEDVTNKFTYINTDALVSKFKDEVVIELNQSTNNISFDANEKNFKKWANFFHTHGYNFK